MARQLLSIGVDCPIMGDHHSAYLFGQLFRELAKEDFDKQKFAALMWEEMKDLDFHWAEMRADEALQRFGYARKRVDPEYPQEGEVWFYGLEGQDRT
jgi:hypothetical protein